MSVYVIEIIMKIIGLGVFKFFDSRWNRSGHVIFYYVAVLNLFFFINLFADLL